MASCAAAFSVREVERADRPAIISIIEKSGNLSEEEKDCARELLDVYLKEGLGGDYRFIAAAGEKDAPVGYACYGPVSLSEGVYDIYWILVDPEFQGMGAGRALVGHIEGLFKRHGGRMLVVETSSTASYERARSFYLRCGFREEARIRDFFKPGDDKVIYVKGIA
ncbi:MAG: GNAT family N-acetyltransferase [Deltaproteobacteria bacterium]|nr:GNAT family N-acetyltransferase [Deltaproteobacteria bacterium]